MPIRGSLAAAALALVASPAAFAATCDIAAPSVPCELNGTTFDTFAGNFSTNRSFFRASSYSYGISNGELCLTLKDGQPHSDGFAYVANYGTTVWTSPDPYNVNFGIFGSFSGSCIRQADNFQWIGAGSPNPPPIAFEWPSRIASVAMISQDYAQFNAVKRNFYHTGLDISVAAGTDVYPSAIGEIVFIQENGNPPESPLRCRPNGKPSNCADHGLGNTVIVRHRLSDGTFLFSQYSHLASILPDVLSLCGPRDSKNRRVCDEARLPQVDPSTSIGTVGGTGYGEANYWPSHLHFEVKRFSTLGTLGHDAGEWGYTSKHPDTVPDVASAFVDPIVYIDAVPPGGGGQSVTTSRSTVARMGPGTHSSGTYPAIANLPAGKVYEVIRADQRQGTETCAANWIQVRPPSIDCNQSGACFRIIGIPKSSVPDAWICSADTSK